MVGDNLLVLGRIHARGATSGIEIDSEWSAVVQFRDGKIVECMGLARPRSCPRSRGTVGVGDVAGERGDRASRDRRVEPWRLGRRAQDAAPSFEFDFSRSMGPGGGVYSLDQMGQHFQRAHRGVGVSSARAGRDHRSRRATWCANTLYVEGRDGIKLRLVLPGVWTLRDGQGQRDICFYRNHGRPSKPWGCRSKTLTADS